MYNFYKLQEVDGQKHYIPDIHGLRCLFKDLICKHINLLKNCELLMDENCNYRTSKSVWKMVKIQGVREFGNGK